MILDTKYKTIKPNIIKIKCLLKKKSGLENFLAAKSAVDEVIITKPIRRRLVIHIKKILSSPLLSKKSKVFFILLISMFLN